MIFSFCCCYCWCCCFFRLLSLLSLYSFVILKLAFVCLFVCPPLPPQLIEVSEVFILFTVWKSSLYWMASCYHEIFIHSFFLCSKLCNKLVALNLKQTFQKKDKEKTSILYLLVSVSGLGLTGVPGYFHLVGTQTLLLIKLWNQQLLTQILYQGQHFLQCMCLETLAYTVKRSYDFAAFQRLKDANWMLRRKN